MIKTVFMVKTAFRALMRDNRGLTLPLLAIALTALIGFAGLGVEAGYWYAIKRVNQSAADMGAVSGVFELASGKPYVDICSLAANAAVQNNFTFQSFTCPTTSPGCTNPSSGQMCANNPPVLGTKAGDVNSVEVILAEQQDTKFASLPAFALSNVNIVTRAVASVQVAGVACSMSLNTTASPAVKFNGNPDICMGSGASCAACTPTCGIAVASTSATSVDFTGTSCVDTAWLDTAGSYKAGGNVTIPTVITNSSTVRDPFSCNPPQIGCAGTIAFTPPTNTTCTNVATTGTISPPGAGVFYCPIQVKNGDNLTLSAGVYYINGDSSGAALSVAGGGTLTGTGVTIIATSSIATSTSATGGGLSISSGATVQLSAPTTKLPTGCTFGTAPCIPPGLLFYQDRDHADLSNNASTDITANSNSALTGAIYAPKQLIKFGGNANSNCSYLIGDTLQFSGTTNMSGSQSDCAGLGITAPELLQMVVSE